MTLNQPLSLFTEVKFPSLPVINGVQTETAITIISTTVEGQGMIPLGLSAKTDKNNKDELADGKLDDISLPYAPQHSGLSNNDSMFILVAMPLSSDNFVGDRNADLTGIVKHYKNGVVEDSIDLSNETYLKLPEDAKVVDNILSFTAIEGANLYIAYIRDKAGEQWVVYSTKNSISLANKPQGFLNISSVIVQAISLKDNNAEFTLNDLLKFNSSNIDSLNRLTSKFSNIVLNKDSF